MKIRNRFTAALGIAFLLQFFASFISGAVLFDPLIAAHDIGAAMVNVARHPASAHLSNFLDIITAVGVIWLAVLLYEMLRKVNKVWAATAMALYFLEVFLLVVSRVFGYAFIGVSERFAAGDQSLTALGQILLQAKDFSGSMAMIPFGLGAILFYYLLYKSQALPAWIPLWGLIAVIPVLIAVPLMAYGVPIPFAVCFPYVPFEFFTGAFILIRGLSDKALPGR